MEANNNARYPTVPARTKWRADKLAIGTRFGRLVVAKPIITIVPRRNGKSFKRTDYICTCDCGKTTKTRAYLLVKGLSTSCGCKTRALLENGFRVGRLVVVEPIENGLPASDGSRLAAYRCQCDCGHICVVRADSLTSTTRPTKSCGCYQGDKVSSLRMSSSDRIMLLHYKTYRNAASSRELAWEIPFDIFAKMCKMDCAYCKRPPELRRWKQMIRKVESEAAAELNGIDRVNNSEGYVSGNVVPACRICNRSKWVLSAEDYISHCTRVAANKQKLEPIDW